MDIVNNDENNYNYSRKYSIIEDKDNKSKNNTNNLKSNKNKDFENKNNTLELKPSRVIYYCPFKRQYAKIENYARKDILDIINQYENDSYYIIEVQNDPILANEVIKQRFQSQYNNINKNFELEIDHCFSPLKDILCLNLILVGGIQNIEYDDISIDKKLIQLIFYRNGLYILNKHGCDSVEEIMEEKFQFTKCEKIEDLFSLTISNKARYSIEATTLFTKDENQKYVNYINNLSLAEFKRLTFKIKNYNNSGIIIFT